MQMLPRAIVPARDPKKQLHRPRSGRFVLRETCQAPEYKPQGSVFGDMFEFTPNADELIIPDVDVDDIDIITNITDANIKAGS